MSIALFYWIDSLSQKRPSSLCRMKSKAKRCLPTVCSSRALRARRSWLRSCVFRCARRLARLRSRIQLCSSAICQRPVPVSAACSDRLWATCWKSTRVGLSRQNHASHFAQNCMWRSRSTWRFQNNNNCIIYIFFQLMRCLPFLFLFL